MSKDNKENLLYPKMASTVEPTEEEKRELYNLANNIPFDDRVNHEASLEDLNITLIQNYLKEINSSLYESAKKMDFVDLCKNMNIVNTLPEYTKPKNVGLMFFCLNPEKFFPYAQIDVVQFPEDLGGDKIIEKTFKGPLSSIKGSTAIHSECSSGTGNKTLMWRRQEDFSIIPLPPLKSHCQMQFITRAMM